MSFGKLGSAIAAILAIGLLVGGGGNAYANGEDNGAVITELPWARLPAEDSGLAIDLWSFNEAQQVESPNGNVILICHFDIPEGYRPAKTLRNSGFLVTTWAAGNTYDTMCVSTPGGKATLWATIHP